MKIKKHKSVQTLLGLGVKGTCGARPKAGRKSKIKMPLVAGENCELLVWAMLRHPAAVKDMLQQ